jgi:uncharacterized membrane protein YeiH
VATGVIGGSGGKIVHDVLRGGYHIAKSPDELRMPTMSVHSSTMAALMYYFLVHVYAVFTAKQGTTLVIIFLVRPPKETPAISTPPSDKIMYLMDISFCK